MTFRCDGRSYDTAEMLLFPTCDVEVPLIFQSTDGGIFVVTRDEDMGIDVHRADDLETRRLAEKYSIPTLLQ